MSSPKKGNDEEQQQLFALEEQEYAGVALEEESENGATEKSPPRRRAPPPVHSNPFLRIWVGSILVLFVGAGLGLVAYRQYTIHRKHAPHSGGNTITDISPTESPPTSWSISRNKQGSFPNNPFDLSMEDQVQFIPPPADFSREDDESEVQGLGYMMQPDVHNDTVVLISQGDVYWSSAKATSEIVAASRLTTTTGNVRTPVLHPTRPWLAYTATYTGHRDVYLMDMSKGKSTSVRRLTYMDRGVLSLSGWKDKDTLILTAYSTAVSLPDLRLYTLHVPTAEIEPVPLAQATDGVWHDNCWYFVRFKQSSQTRRYVGGTAESLWGWCADQLEAIRLDPTYKGTMKQPRIYKGHLLFISDRNEEGVPTNLNLWAIPLPKLSESYRMPSPIRLTNTCQFGSLPVMEYSVDGVTGNIVVRIGATLHQLSESTVEGLLKKKMNGVTKPTPLQIRVYSDFSDLQERIIPAHDQIANLDVVASVIDQQSALVNVRGQAWMIPVVDSGPVAYQGSGQNIPQRRYRVAPGGLTGGMVRVLQAVHMPPKEPETEKERYAILLVSYGERAEHAFMRVRVDTDAPNSFSNATLDTPLFDGIALGSVKEVQVSPCGHRLAWTNTNGEIYVADIDGGTPISLSAENDNGEPMNGADATLSWSPMGRYLAIEHAARNQFQVISLADCGQSDSPLAVSSITQATPSRFNSFDAYFGVTSRDLVARRIGELAKKPFLSSFTTLFFLCDRNVQTDVGSPWGTRAPGPHFTGDTNVYALPLAKDEGLSQFMAPFAGGGAREVLVDELLELDKTLEAVTKDTSGRRLREMSLVERATVAQQIVGGSQSLVHGRRDEEAPEADAKPVDPEIRVGGDQMLSRAYRVAHVPSSHYFGILTQTVDDASLVLVEKAKPAGAGVTVKLFKVDPYPSDDVEVVSSVQPVTAWGESTSRGSFYIRIGGKFKVIPTTSDAVRKALADLEVNENIVDVDGLAVSVWPALEYQQMYNDAWRMLRDYFYDPEMHQVDWASVFTRYKFLVDRCSKREELDDVLAQMASELSALHVFVYGGEYDQPFGADPELLSAHLPASLGAELKLSKEWKGYVVTEIPERDPDFNLIGRKAVYCPISDQTLAPTGQRGLNVGDVIVAINGESVMKATNIYMMLRGTAGRSVRLEILRLSEANGNSKDSAPIESLVVVPITPDEAASLRYNAWKWKTRQSAKAMAKEKDFSLAYIHLSSMMTSDMNDFARNFFPDYDKDALILDVRHNRGGNIDSWIISFLQRQAWMYWGDRVGVRTGSLDWDEQFAFRGHIVVLIDEHTSSDGEGVSRGLSELGLARLVGTRTWGGGIWLSSDNHLVDGGIATAPEIGTFNQQFGWGLGIEQQGAEPDINVDNNPRTSFDGTDTQLERAIEVLEEWLKSEPIVQPKPPLSKPDMSNPETCST